MPSLRDVAGRNVINPKVMTAGGGAESSRFGGNSIGARAAAHQPATLPCRAVGSSCRSKDGAELAGEWDQHKGSLKWEIDRDAETDNGVMRYGTGG